MRPPGRLRAWYQASLRRCQPPRQRKLGWGTLTVGPHPKLPAGGPSRAHSTAVHRLLIVPSRPRSTRTTSPRERWRTWSDPVRWHTAATGWLAAGQPYPAAYARWREAEALLARRASRGDVAAILRQAHET